MRRVDRRRSCHRRLLWVGYGLVLTVIVLLSLATTGAIQVYHLRAGATALAQRVADVSDDNKAAREELAAQVRENKRQDELLTTQQRQARKRDAAIAALRKLRQQDTPALTALHNELAARYVDDARVKQRLQQLEASNATARRVISTAPTSAPMSPPKDQP